MFPLFESKLVKSVENRDRHWYWLTSSSNPPLSLSLTEGNTSLFCVLMVQQKINFPSSAFDRLFWESPLSTIPSGPLETELSQTYFWKDHRRLFLLGDCKALQWDALCFICFPSPAPAVFVLTALERRLKYLWPPLT